MPRPGRLLACPSCSRHFKSTEPHCPHCGAAVRQADGSMQRSAAAILLGLSAAVAACDGIAPAPVYGAPATGGSGGAVSSTGGSGGETSMPAYGIPATGGSPGTGGSASTGGAGGSGGTAGMAGSGGETAMPAYGIPATGGGGN